jgi:hypothetical protein
VNSEAYLDIGIECSECGVVFQEVGCLLGATGVVDHDDLQVGAVTAVQASQELATNAAESVDCNLALLSGHGHITVCVGAALQARTTRSGRCHNGSISNSPNARTMHVDASCRRTDSLIVHCDAEIVDEGCAGCPQVRASYPLPSPSGTATRHPDSDHPAQRSIKIDLRTQHRCFEAGYGTQRIEEG